ncbi:very short patch repair endonuclease [Pedobacter sp. Leaf250]|uniref:very short patch repair endonuclease n=1 Tax=Pedobacter sp. Leaf250 TaxID=2876559 RepID=UPI001E5A9190|nr:DNA mismatch endonuclease Vsr [Pedobacter sp. Leaf250]
MADVHSKEVRSFNMSQIKGKNTRPEIIVRKFLHSRGFRFRIHSKFLPGKPDIVLPRYRTAIFINGCFWHGHEGCRYFVVPKTRTDFWMDKIYKNISRDSDAESALRHSGWKVIIIWECKLKKATLTSTLEGLINEITSSAIKRI